MDRGFTAALRRALPGIVIMAVIYATSLGVGIVMAHSGNRFALQYRDSIVARAHQDDPAARAQRGGAHATAAAIDFSRNLGLVAIPETLGGLTFVLPVGLAAYRGWVGGIVSVDARHESRLGNRRSAVYYLVTVALQLAGFTLADGAGLYLGWSFFKRRGDFVGPSWFRLPRQALIDIAWIYALIVPSFAAGSIWEFFAGG